MASTVPNGHHDREHERVARTLEHHEERIAQLERGLGFLEQIAQDVHEMKTMPRKVVKWIAGVGAGLAAIALALAQLVGALT